MTILFAGISAVFGMLALNGLPMPYHPVFNVPRFAMATKDRFFLIVFSTDPKYKPDWSAPVSGRPGAAFDFGGARVSAMPCHPQTLLAYLFRCSCRSRAAVSICTSSRGRIRCRKAISSRPALGASLVRGTSRAENLREDTYLYTGKIGNNPGDYMPFPVTKEVLARGQRALQHLLRALPFARGRWQWVHPVSWFSAQAAVVPHRSPARKRQSDTSSDVITEGFGFMPDYASQIPPRDRWGIVAYIRALQLSQHATAADVPGHPDPVSRRRNSWTRVSGATLPRVKTAKPAA